MQVGADSLGSYLRRERELREKSLQDISAATKIQLKFLQALELDDYDQLPPTPFVVGFLRAYAQCLSLEPEEIIATYHTRHNSSAVLEGPASLVAYQGRASHALSCARRQPLCRRCCHNGRVRSAVPDT